ncbi:MAG TPA: hypothetical protein VG944_08440 [Fimbriimonas sp.]|nr:hypothetical protein [Fimbriimonas sp.]
MADREKEVGILLTDHNIDASKVAHLKCPPYVVLVEMLPAGEKIGNIFLPDRLAANMRPDVGIVLSAGYGVSLKPGQMVAVDGYQGQWLQEFEVPGYKTDNQVRVYGKSTAFVHGECERIPWDECTLALIIPETMEMTASHTNLFVRRDPMVTTDRGFLMPSKEHYFTGMATVESVGPMAFVNEKTGEKLMDVKPGDRIHYDTRAEREFAFEGDSDLVIIPDIAVNFVIEPVEELAVAV